MADPVEAPENYDEAWKLNMKRFVDEWAQLSGATANSHAALQDKMNAQYLRWVDDQHTLLMRTADFGAAGLQKNADALAVFQQLILAGEIDTTAQGAVGAKMAEEFRSAAKLAVEAAVAAVPGTSAPSQGVTGVAQGGLQMQLPPEMAQLILDSNTVQAQILAELAKIDAALSDLLVKAVAK